MDNNVQFIESDPLKGARRPKTTGVRVDSNGVPLDIIAKQKENQKTAPDDITNDPNFEKMFGNCKEIKLTELNCHIEPYNYGCVSLVKN